MPPCADNVDYKPSPHLVKPTKSLPFGHGRVHSQTRIVAAKGGNNLAPKCRDVENAENGPLRLRRKPISSTPAFLLAFYAPAPKNTKRALARNPRHRRMSSMRITKSPGLA